MTAQTTLHIAHDTDPAGARQAADGLLSALDAGGGAIVLELTGIRASQVAVQLLLATQEEARCRGIDVSLGPVAATHGAMFAPVSGGSRG